MHEFTIKELEHLLNIRQQNIDKAIRNIVFISKKVEGSSKKVKHYKLEDLPQRYKEKLKEKGIEEIIVERLLPSAFTRKYLLASKSKQNEALLRCSIIDRYLKKDVSINIASFLEHINNDSIEFESLGTITQKKLFDWLKKYNMAKAKA